MYEDKRVRGGFCSLFSHMQEAEGRQIFVILFRTGIPGSRRHRCCVRLESYANVTLQIGFTFQLYLKRCSKLLNQHPSKTLDMTVISGLNLRKIRKCISQYKDYIPKWVKMWPCKMHVHMHFYAIPSERNKVLLAGRAKLPKQQVIESLGPREKSRFFLPRSPTPAVPHTFPLGVRLCFTVAKN